MDEPKTMEIPRISVAIILSFLTSLVTSQLVLSETETTSGGNGNNTTNRIYIPVQRPCLFLSYRNRELYSQIKRYERLVDANQHLMIKDSFTRPRLRYNSFPQDSRLSKIAVQYASIGDFEQALNLVQAIQKERPKVETIIAIAEFYVEEGEKQLALETVSEAVDLAQNAEGKLLKDELFFSITNIYLKVIDSYLEVEEKKLASEFALLALQYIENIEEELPKRYLLSKLAPQLSAVGKVEEALATTNQLDITQDERNRIWEQIAISAAGFGKVEEGLKIAQNLGENRRNYTILQIAIKLASNGQFDQSMKIARNFQVNQGLVIANIAKQYIKQGEMNQAISKVQNIEDYCSRSEAFYELSLLLVEEEYDLALQIADNIEATNIKSHALQAVALKLVQVEKYEPAKIVIQSIEIPKDKADAFIEVSRSLIEAGKSEQASEFLSQALEIVKSSPDLTRVYPQIPSAISPQSPRITSPPIVPPARRIRPSQPVQQPVLSPQGNN